MELPTDEVLLGSAINFLYEGQEIYEASLLLLCEIKTHPWNRYDEVITLMIEIIGNRVIYDVFQNDAFPSKGFIERAFNAILPNNSRSNTCTNSETNIQAATNTATCATNSYKASMSAVNSNYWCYNFNPGNLIYIPPSGFCNYFHRIPTFYGSDYPAMGISSSAIMAPIVNRVENEAHVPIMAA